LAGSAAPRFSWSRAAGEAKLAGEALLRRLAAILAAGGYLRLVEAEEERTLARLKSLRRTRKTASEAMPIEFAGAVETAPIAAR
jgi:hypothetical protein